MLLLGVLYGTAHFKSLQKKENKFREEEAALAPARQKQLEAEKARLTRGENITYAGTQSPASPVSIDPDNILKGSIRYASLMFG